jgi:hypothetical protein
MAYIDACHSTDAIRTMGDIRNEFTAPAPSNRRTRPRHRPRATHALASRSRRVATICPRSTDHGRQKRQDRITFVQGAWQARSFPPLSGRGGGPA